LRSQSAINRHRSGWRYGREHHAISRENAYWDVSRGSDDGLPVNSLNVYISSSPSHRQRPLLRFIYARTYPLADHTAPRAIRATRGRDGMVRIYILFILSLSLSFATSTCSITDRRRISSSTFHPWLYVRCANVIGSIHFGWKMRSALLRHEADFSIRPDAVRESASASSFRRPRLRDWITEIGADGEGPLLDLVPRRRGNVPERPERPERRGAAERCRGRFSESARKPRAISHSSCACNALNALRAATCLEFFLLRDERDVENKSNADRGHNCPIGRWFAITSTTLYFAHKNVFFFFF